MGTGQVVQITINVTDANAGAVVQEVVAQLNAIGPAGEAAGAKAGAGLDQVGGHALSARDNVRLLNEDLGLHIPRAMQRVIGNSQMLSAAIGMIGPGLIAMGAVDIFAHMAESAYNLYEKYIDIGAAQRELLDTIEKSKDKDFVNVHSIETAQLRIEQATSAMVNFQGIADGMSKTGWADIMQGLANPGSFGTGIGELITARKMAGLGAKGAGETQELSPAQQSLQHQLNQANIEAQYSGDAVLKGHAKITAELQKQLDLHKEAQRYTAITDRERGNPGTAGSGRELQAAEDAAARAKAHAAEIELQRHETDQIIQMQNEATNAGLQGNALRAAQEQEAIEAVTRKFQEGEISKRAAASETALIQQKFAAEAFKLQEQLDEQTKHLADEAAQAGLKGMPLINAQLWTQLDAIDAEEKKAVGRGGAETPQQTDDFASQRASAWKISNQKTIESQEQFNARIHALTESADDNQLQGYARIEAETRKHLQTLSTDYQAQYGQDRAGWTGYQQAKTQIEDAAEQQRQRLHQRTMEQATREEEQAARMGLAPWRQSMLAIEDQYQDRLRKIQDDVKFHVMTEQEGAAATTAAWQLAAVQMQKSEEDTRNKLASGLQQLFSNPAQFFEKRAMDTAFQLMANEMLSTFKSSSPAGGMLQYLFGMGPEMNTSANPMSALGSAFGMGSHGASGTAGASTMISFQQGSTQLLTSSQVLFSAATALQSAAGTLSFGAGTAGMGGGLGFGGGGGLGMLGSGAGAMGMGGGGFAGGGGTAMMDISGLNHESGHTESALNAGMAPGKLGAAMGIAGGTLMAGMGAFNAYQNSDPLSGLVSGAMGGMEAGAAIGSIIPGLGTVVGGAIGAIAGGIGGLLAGVFGDKGKGQAQDFDKGTVQPTLMKDLQDYESGRSGYNTLSSELNSLMISAQNSTYQWGSGARNYFGSTIRPEIEAVLSSLQKQEIGGRSKITMSAAQFHGGGSVGDFGDFSTGPGEGFAKLLAHEFVVQPMAAQAHGPLLNAINSGSVSYGAVQSRMPASSSSGGDVHLHIQAIDAKSFEQWAQGGGGRMLVSALNQAQRQYSGVGRG